MMLNKELIETFKLKNNKLNIKSARNSRCSMLKEILIKPIPKNDEVLMEFIRNICLSAADWRLRKADPFLARLFNGLFKTKKS